MSITEQLPQPQTAAETSPRPNNTAQLSTLVQPAQHRGSAILMLALLCGALFFYGLNIGDLYRTEALRAIIGAEFLRTGDWVVPRLYGAPLLTKPPGMYAAIAAASWPWGQVTEWTARLPSALAATAVVFLFYWYVSRQVGRFGGLIAAAIIPCGYLWLEKASAAEIDMLQLAWVSASLLFFFRAVECCEEVQTEPGPLGSDEPARLRSRLGNTWSGLHWWLLALLCVAGGLLTKWTAPVFFYATAIPFLFWRRRLRLLWSPQHLVSALLAAGVCLTWVGLVIHQVGWQELHTTVLAEGLPRVSHGHYWGDSLFWETVRHPFWLLLVNLPWSMFALPTLIPSFFSLWDERGRRLLQAFHCWAWSNVLVWTILPDHTIRHSFPLCPGIVGLGAMTWVALLSGKLSNRWLWWQGRLALLSLLALGLVALSGLTAAVWMLPQTTWWLVLVLAAMTIWCLREGFLAWRADRFSGVLFSIILMWFVLKVAYVQLYVPVRTNREPRAKAEVLVENVPPGEVLYVFQRKDEGIMFYYGRPVVWLKQWKELPHSREPVYCVLQQDEWQHLNRREDWEITRQVPLKDEQGNPIMLVGVQRREPPIRHAMRVAP